MTLGSRTRVGLVDGDPAIRRDFVSLFGSQPDFVLGGVAGTAMLGFDLLSNQELDVMLVSAYTVGSHVKNIYRKLDVHSRTEAVYEARQLGIMRD